MKHKIKSFLTTPFVCLILIISMFALPISANAEAGTLGTETPDLSCVFTNSNGDKVNGNVLESGTYTVDIVLKGMKAVSIVELTANIDTDVLTAASVKSTYADTHEDMTKGGEKIEGSTISLFLVSENADSSPIDTNGTVMVSLSVTVASSCDFADVFTFSEEPNLCFIEASYLDGYEDCYVLDTTKETTYKTYPMTADASPAFEYKTFDVYGTMTVTNDLQGSATAYPAAGLTIAVEGTQVSATTAEDGTFVLAGLEPGEYNVKISGPTTIDRTVGLTVNQTKTININSNKINVQEVGICVVDYNKDGKINVTDVALFSRAKTDLDNSGEFDAADKSIFKTFFEKTVSYAQLNL